MVTGGQAAGSQGAYDAVIRASKRPTAVPKDNNTRPDRSSTSFDKIKASVLTCGRPEETREGLLEGARTIAEERDGQERSREVQEGTIVVGGRSGQPKAPSPTA